MLIFHWRYLFLLDMTHNVADLTVKLYLWKLCSCYKLSYRSNVKCYKHLTCYFWSNSCLWDHHFLICNYHQLIFWSTSVFTVSQLLPVETSKTVRCLQPSLEVCLGRCIAVHLHAYWPWHVHYFLLIILQCNESHQDKLSVRTQNADDS